MADAPPLLKATQLTRRFGGLTAVDRVSIELYRGTLHAVIGTNGAGKSTLLDMLSGETAPTSGRIEFDGHDVSAWPQPKRARAGIGRSHQRTTVFPSFTAHENCRLSAQAARPRAWAVWQGAQHCAPSNRAAGAALDAVGLAEHAQRLAGALSHGAQRQLEIAMCLATGPRVLLLDEPLAGMGAEETERMLTLLDRLKREHAVLLIEHDMAAVFRIADRVTVMVDGAVIASDTADRIRTDAAVQAAYLGEPARAT